MSALSLNPLTTHRILQAMPMGTTPTYRNIIGFSHGLRKKAVKIGQSMDMTMATRICPVTVMMEIA